MSPPSGSAESSCPDPPVLIAVDIGNARIKLGQFRTPCDTHGARSQSSRDEKTAPTSPSVATALPSPLDTLTVDGRRPDWNQLSDWLAKSGASAFSWWIGSVNRPATTTLLDWLRETRMEEPVTILASTDLPLTVRLPNPDKVGVDRLLDAVAANRLRTPGHPAVIVDVGTAITVDLIADDGAFCGGAILPGIAMSARALHEFTDLLPQVDVDSLHEPPAAVGASTIEAIQSGLFWYAVGAVRELTARMAAEHQRWTGAPTASEPNVMITGGAGETVARLLGREASLVPHLTLAGIALAAQAGNAQSC